MTGPRSPTPTPPRSTPLDALTDRIVAPAFGALDDDGAGALLTGLRAMGQRLKPAPIPEV